MVNYRPSMVYIIRDLITAVRIVLKRKPLRDMAGVYDNYVAINSLDRAICRAAY